MFVSCSRGLSADRPAMMDSGDPVFISVTEPSRSEINRRGYVVSLEAVLKLAALLLPVFAHPRFTSGTRPRGHSRGALIVLITGAVLRHPTRLIWETKKKKKRPSLTTLSLFFTEVTSVEIADLICLFEKGEGGRGDDPSE